ncbi:MAG: M23 family metallopeptidase [Bacilli bacterium]|nr:M23 family metallopeptidase [Bacilli bacterium]
MYRKLNIFISKTLITAIITLIMLIFMKASSKFKQEFYKYVFDTHISFTQISNLYNKYFGNIIEIPTYKEQTVFKEKLSYKNKDKYYDGVKLSVSKDYLVPIQESGLVVFIGEKENYGNVVIIQQVNGIDMWYGNMNNVDVKLYDYVEKGSILGIVNDNLYIVYKKDGKVLNYEDYI